MKIKKSLLITAGAALLGAAGTVGGTMALFTSESGVDVTVKSANVTVSAEVKNLTLSSGKWDGSQYVDEDRTAAGKFTTGGTAKIEGSSVMLENVVPMDKVAFDIEVKNLSTVAIKARTIFRVLDDNGLVDALKITIGNEVYQGMTKVGEWKELAVGQGNETIHVTIELPKEAGNEYQGKSFKLGFNVEAVQGNAATEEAVDADYLIYNATDLRVFSKIQRSNQASIAGKTVVLMDDIDLEGVEYEPIDVTSVDYSFTFDGQDHTISNMKLVGKHDLGLFAHAASSLIKNVKMDKANIKGIGRLGAVAGHVLCGKIENCEVTNSTFVADPNILDAAGEYNGDKVGGIVGYLSAEPAAYIKNCKAENLSITGYRDLGGIAGIANGSNFTVTGNTAKKISFVNDRTNNYNNIIEDAKFNIDGVVGRKGTTGEYSGNSSEEVTISHLLAPTAATVQEVFEEAEAGDTVLIPAAQPIEIPNNVKEGVVIQGLGEDSHLVVKASSTATIPNDVVIKDLTLDLSATQTTAGSVKVKDTAVFENVTFAYETTAPKYAVTCTGDSDVLFKDCNFALNGKTRGIMVWGGSNTITIDNCTFDCVYPFNVDSGTPHFIVKNSVLNGWTSYGASASVEFENCRFGKSTSGYAYCRPYSNTKFTECEFAEGYLLDFGAAGITLTLSGCKQNGAAIDPNTILDIAELSNSGTLVIDGVSHPITK